MKNKYVSRTKNRIAAILMAGFTVFLLFGYISQLGVLMLFSILLLIASIIIMLSANRCPYCGEYFRGLYWSKANAGYCRKCGKIIEFDDSCKN